MVKRLNLSFATLALLLEMDAHLLVFCDLFLWGLLFSTFPTATILPLEGEDAAET